MKFVNNENLNWNASKSVNELKFSKNHLSRTRS